jgi:glycolate oxidase FAD binding subunit
MASSTANALFLALPAERWQQPDRYAIDGITPSRAARPENREEVSSLLSAATSAGLVVVPQGARTALELGCPLAGYDVALDLTALDRIVAYEADDLTITVEAGVTLGQLQTHLDAHGQYLSTDPPPGDGVTIGGLLATARSGAWRGHLPSARDLVLGIEVALADGQRVKSGGRVVKNVSGYDLHRMHTGALGAFGVIVEASFKLAPLPAATRTFVLRCDDMDAAESLAFDLWNRSTGARALTLLSAPAASVLGLSQSPHVLVELAGVASAVERGAEVTARLGQVVDGPASLWRDLRGLPSDGTTVLRIVVPAAAIREAIDDATNAGCRAWGHLAAGSVVALAPDGDAAAIVALRASAERLGGTLQIESGPPSLRVDVDPFDVGEPDLVRSLKAQFDPTGTLNRGRWMEGV